MCDGAVGVRMGCDGGRHAPARLSPLPPMQSCAAWPAQTLRSRLMTSEAAPCAPRACRPEAAPWSPRASRPAA
eukprot:150609-Prymnesium_polylepis.1